MRIYRHKNVRFDGDWEIGILTKRWQLRIGRSQIALWRHHGSNNFTQLFGWLSRRAGGAA